jgi:hypothetical protein
MRALLNKHILAPVAAIALCAVAAAFAYAAVPNFSMPGFAPTATPAVASSLQAQSTARNIVSLNVTSGATAGFVLILDSAGVPGAGAVTPIKCYEIAANSTLDLHWGATPLTTVNGIAVLFSTTGCFTYTLSATAFFSGEFQ